jgi:hypothetical protein
MFQRRFEVSVETLMMMMMMRMMRIKTPKNLLIIK